MVLNMGLKRRGFQQSCWEGHSTWKEHPEQQQQKKRGEKTVKLRCIHRKAAGGKAGGKGWHHIVQGLECQS